MASDGGTLWGIAVVIISGLTGHNYLQIGQLREDKAKVPENYRAKSDCALICTSFQKTMDEMKKDMNHGFDRLSDKLDVKEDKK